MSKKLILPITIAALALAQSACNSKSEEYDYDLSNSTLVSAFSLQDNENVLDSLSNVYFTIDQENAKIYNADSLPYGTRVNALIPSITAVSTAQIVTLEFKTTEQTDTIIDYLTNSTDSIDFSQGSVKLRVVSASGIMDRTYQIYVNVHTVKPDTLAWRQMESAALPTAFGTPDAQCTAHLGDTFYCLTSKSGNYALATTKKPDDPNWDVNEVSLPFEANVESLRATDDALYMLDQQGNLYKSADFSAWESTSQQFYSLYGNYGEQLLGCKASGGDWVIASYPSNKTWTLPAKDFPIEGASLPATYSAEFAYAPQLVMVGGVDAIGKYVPSAWSFDGNEWANVTNPRRELPEGLYGPSVVAYGLFDVPSSTWRPVQYPALVLIGGKMADGTVNHTVYISRDWGMSWDEASELMQLPAGVPDVYNASSFVYATTMNLNSRGRGWDSIWVKGIPSFCTWVETSKASRITSAITEWECPAIYMFAGRKSSGQTIDSVWRGQILRYTFPPKY